jgi:hypothetical protein
MVPLDRHVLDLARVPGRRLDELEMPDDLLLHDGDEQFARIEVGVQRPRRVLRLREQRSQRVARARVVLDTHAHVVVLCVHPLRPRNDPALGTRRFAQHRQVLEQVAVGARGCGHRGDMAAAGAVAHGAMVRPERDPLRRRQERTSRARRLR